MEIKEGYKKTDTGVIPLEWECMRFGDCIESTKLGGNYANDTRHTYYPLIKMGNIGRGFIKLNKIEYVKNTIPKKVDELKFGDLLFNTRNTLELVGKVAIWRNELLIAYYNSNLMSFIFKKDFIATNFFVNYMLNTKLMISKLKDIATGTTSVAAIYSRDLFNICLPIPPLPEQQAIATTLSDIDGLIGSLTKLIKKKKNIKQAAMQELLTGKKRLDGFSGEWVEVRLGDVANINMGQSPNSFFYNISKIGLPLIQGNADIDMRKTVIRFYTSQITKIANKNDIIMTVRAPVGYVAKANFNCCIGRGVCSIKYDNDLLYHYLVFVEDKWSTISTGSTFDSINSTELKQFTMVFPPTNEEQTAIATIISDMDNEIEVLEQKLDKYKNIKQGMMQELLTGKTRLL